MKKILFINPAYKEDVLWNVLKIPPLGLATLAALTPENYHMKIVDENVSVLNPMEEADLVVISSMTYNAPKAYEIASGFRSRGIPVVMGGIHTSMLPNEAIAYCDSVVVGEAESVWPRVIHDFENNALQNFYYGERRMLENMPIPRRDLFEKKYKIHTVQTSRGCPFNCEFCSVTKFSGGIYRQRPVSEVITEVSTLSDKTFIFADDNIFGAGIGAEKRAISLFEQLKPLNKKWGSQASINVADNEEVLKSAVDSGAVGFFIGIESLNEKSLTEMKKGINLKYGVKGYKRVIKQLHDYGITVTGAFVVGNDSDNKDVFQDIIDFVYDTDLDRVQATISTPLPGTGLYNKLISERRILYTNYPLDWRKYDVYHAVFEPRKMTVEELENGLLQIYRETSSLKSSLERAFRSLIVTKRLFSSAISFFYNRSYGNAVISSYKPSKSFV